MSEIKKTFNKTCVDCDSRFETKTGNKRFCDDCAKKNKIERDKARNNRTWQIAVTGMDRGQKKDIEYLFAQIKKEHKNQNIKYDKAIITEKALNVYLDFLQGEIE